MSFENHNQNQSAHEQTEVPKRGKIAHALFALTNGLISKKTERSSESGFVVAALEKATETKEALQKFDPEGEFGEMAEKGLSALYEKIRSKFAPSGSDL